MEQYLGICMVIVVSGIVLAVLARLMTGGILDEIERIKSIRFKKRCEMLAQFIKGSSEYVGKYLEHCKEAMKMDAELGEKGQKYAKEGFEKTAKEMKHEFFE